MDIVERLTAVHKVEADFNIGGIPVVLNKWVNPDGPEAVKEIERLREALNRCADLSEKWEDSLVSQINLIARSALQQKESE